MICDKCGGTIDFNMKCNACGYDNSTEDLNPANQRVLVTNRSTRITIFMSLIIIINIIYIIGNLSALFSKCATSGSMMFSGILIVLSIGEIIICFFVLKMRKWALYTYIVLSVIGAINLLLNLEILIIIFIALLLYFIFRNDWEYFFSNGYLLKCLNNVNKDKRSVFT